MRVFRAFYLVTGLNDEYSAASDGDEGAIFYYLVADGKLKSFAKRFVFERIFTSVN